jgi:hypothetical protein
MLSLAPGTRVTRVVAQLKRRFLWQGKVFDRRRGGLQNSITVFPPASKPQPTVRPSGSFSVRASISPNPVSYGSYPTLYAYSSPGAVCTASVLYSTGSAPVSFSGSAQTVGGSGSYPPHF